MTVILVYFIYTAPSRVWPSSFCMVVDGSVVACIIDFYFCLLMTDGHNFRGGRVQYAATHSQFVQMFFKNSCYRSKVSFVSRIGLDY